MVAVEGEDLASLTDARVDCNQSIVDHDHHNKRRGSGLSRRASNGEKGVSHSTEKGRPFFKCVRISPRANIYTHSKNNRQCHFSFHVANI